MPQYTGYLKDRKEIAEGTMAFYFEKPEGFMFKAGQYCDWTLINPPETDEEGNTRSSSLASAPHEPELMIASRMRDSAFKRVLRTAPEGFEIAMEGPMGAFTLHQNALRPAVFLAGGIGITPFRSMIVDAAERQLPHELYLFYSNRRPQDAAFLQELAEVTTRNSHFHSVPTMTQPDASAESWKGEKGYITKAMLERHLTNLTGPVYYTAGPPEMVNAMRTMLVEAGISEDDIRSEDFAGY